MDRRLIHSRIGQLKEQLEQVQKHRELIRSQRDKSRVKVAAIVGYTNAGKSTLLNTMTQAGVLRKTSYLPRWIQRQGRWIFRANSRFF